MYGLDNILHTDVVSCDVNVQRGFCKKIACIIYFQVQHIQYTALYGLWLTRSIVPLNMI